MLRSRFFAENNPCGDMVVCLEKNVGSAFVFGVVCICISILVSSSCCCAGITSTTTHPLPISSFEFC